MGMHVPFGCGGKSSRLAKPYAVMYLFVRLPRLTIPVIDLGLIHAVWRSFLMGDEPG